MNNFYTFVERRAGVSPVLLYWFTFLSDVLVWHAVHSLEGFLCGH